MESKSFLCLTLIFASWVFVGFSQFPAGFPIGLLQSGIVAAAADDSVTGSLPCVQKLLPCQPYLTNPTAPPSSCCVPLKEMITDEPKCLCDIFNNPAMLQTISVSQTDALKLLKACGVNADISVCNKSSNSTGAPSPTPETPSSSTALSNGSSSTSASSPPPSSSDNSTSTTTTTKSSASEISAFGGFGFIAILMFLFV